MLKHSTTPQIHVQLARKADKPLAEKELQCEDGEETSSDESSLVKAGQSSLPESTDAKLRPMSPIHPENEEVRHASSHAMPPGLACQTERAAYHGGA